MNAPKRAPTKASTASSFKKKSLPLIELPSGNFVRLRRPGMEKFLSAGFLPDALAKEVSKTIGQHNGRAQDIAMLQDPSPEQITDYLRMLDKVTAFCVSEPEVTWHERPVAGEVVPGQSSFEDVPEDERNPEVVYTDEMEMTDKTFIFQYAVGGSADLTQFRKESAAVMAALQPGGSLGSDAESAAVPD